MSNGPEAPPNQSGSGMSISIILAVCCCILLLVVVGLYIGDILCDMGSWAGMSCPDQELLSPDAVTPPSLQKSTPPPPPTETPPAGTQPEGTPPPPPSPPPLPPQNPTSSLITSGTALQVSEIDLGTASVPATNMPTLTSGSVTGFSLSMWVKLPETVTPGVWWTLFSMGGHAVTLIPDTGTPTLWEIVFSTSGPTGANWSYMYRLTPGTYYRLGFVVSPPSAPTFYLNGGPGITDSNMNGTGIVSHSSTGSDARFNPNNSPLSGIKVKNAYYFGTSLTASEMDLLGASGMGSGTTSGYMPQPLPMGVSGYVKEGYMVPY